MFPYRSLFFNLSGSEIHMLDLFAFIKAVKEVIDIPSVALCLGLLIYVAVLAKWHVSSGAFDFRAALLDPPTPGSVSLSRMGQLTALVVSTSVLVFITVKSGTVPEWMFAAYMAAWAGTYLAAKFAPKDPSKQ